jgi:hypothetical protein
VRVPALVLQFSDACVVIEGQRLTELQPFLAPPRDRSSDHQRSENRALPDAELDGFVDALARRIASFDRRAIAGAKSLINQVSLPSADRLLDALDSFQIALTGLKRSASKLC